MHTDSYDSARGRRRVGRIVQVSIAIFLALVLVLDPFSLGSANAQTSSSKAEETREENAAKALDALPEVDLLDAEEMTGSKFDIDDSGEIPAIPADVPGASEATLDVPKDGVAKADLDGMKVEIATPMGETAPGDVHVEVAKPAEAKKEGITGVVLDLTAETAEESSSVEVTVSYATFAGMGGGDWASRLQLVHFPECPTVEELSKPEEPAPSPTPTSSPTPTVAPTPSDAPTPTPTAEPSAAPSATAGPSVTATPSATAAPSATVAPTSAPSPTAMSTPTATATPSTLPTDSPSPSATVAPRRAVSTDETPTPTPTPSVTPMPTPTAAPVVEAPCPPVPLETRNDPEAQTLTAIVPLTEKEGASAGASESVARLAVTSSTSPSGAGGDWSATNLSPSATWGMSGNSGAFTWGYPIDVPAVSAGPAPELALGYSSAVSDGRVPSSNNQSGWIGEGFDMSTGYVERTYTPCQKDLTGTPNNADLISGDLCWGQEQLTLVFKGAATPMIKDAATGVWYAETADGTRIERLTGGWSGGSGLLHG